MHLRCGFLHTHPPPLTRLRFTRCWLVCGAKRHRSSRSTEGEDARVRNKERTYLEDASRASLIDEETLLMRAREIVVRASSSRPETSERSTTDGS